MSEPTDTPGDTQSSTEATSPILPIQIPTRGGSVSATDPSAPGVKPSSYLDWLRETMSKAPGFQPSSQPQPTSRTQDTPQAQPTPNVKPSRSDLSAASPSMFVGATSRRESGQLQPLSLDPRSETSLINPSASSPSVPVSSSSQSVNRQDQVLSPNEFPFPTTDTGISVPTTAVPSMPSGASFATSSGVSTIQQDPDETVSLTYFGREPRRYRSDADVAHDAASDEGSEEVSYDDTEDRLDVEDSPDDQPTQGPLDRQNDIYNDILFRDSLSELAIDIERKRLKRRIEARKEEDEQGASRARQAALAANARRTEESPIEFDMPGRSIHFQEPLLPVSVSVPIAPQPGKWTKGLQRGISRLFGREPRSTPDLELGDQRIPYAQKGKGRADAPPSRITKPPKVQPPPKLEKPKIPKPVRDSPTPNLLQRLKGKPVPRGDFLDMSSDHGSPLQLPAMPSISGVTRKLSFRRQPQSPRSWLDMGPDPFAKEPIRIIESAPPATSRLSTVYERATRALTIKKRPVPAPYMHDPNLSKAEQVLGIDLSSYKATQSYPDLLSPIPRHSTMKFSNPNLRSSSPRPATSSGPRPGEYHIPMIQPRPISFSPETSLRVPTQPRPRSFAGNHPFYTAGLPPREPPSKGLPPREPLINTTQQVTRDFGKWIKRISRPSTADGTKRTSWAPINPVTGVPNWRVHPADRRASVGSRADSVAQRLERMVSTSSSQLEPARPTPQPALLYPGGIDPIADPELYQVVQQFEMHRRAEDERRAEEERTVSESSELHISATSFPMPPTPRQVPVRRSSLPRQVPVSPRLLSPNAPPRPWRTPSPVHSLQVVVEDSPPSRGPALVLGPELPTPVAPINATAPAPSPARVESSPGALAGYEALSPVHPLPQTTPNVLGLSTAPSTSTSSRVSFAPSPPRHSHVDLKEFLMQSPSQIIRTTSAAEFRRPADTGPLIPQYPASYRELERYIIAESDIWKRQEQDFSSSTDFDEIWPSEPRYAWRQYRMVLTSARRELDQDDRSAVLPPDLKSTVCIHLFKARPRSRPSTAPGSKLPPTPAKYDPEVTRRYVTDDTRIAMFQPYTVDSRGYHRGQMWRDEDNEVDVTKIWDSGGERVCYLTLPDLQQYASWSHTVAIQRHSIIAGRCGCGIAFRDRLARGSYNTSAALDTLLLQEVASARGRWETRRLALDGYSPPPSPIRPAPKIVHGQPSKSILKKTASTGDIRSSVPDIGPVSQMQGYIDGLTSWSIAYDEERGLREARYREEGLYDPVPRIRTATDSTIKPSSTGQGVGEASGSAQVLTKPVQTIQPESGIRPPPASRTDPSIRPEHVARPTPATRPQQASQVEPVKRTISSRPVSRPYASTSQLDTQVTFTTRHRERRTPASQTLSPIEPTPALSEASLPSIQDAQSPEEFISIHPRSRRPKRASSRKAVPSETNIDRSDPPEDPETNRSYHDRDDPPNERLTDFVDEFMSSREEFGDVLGPALDDDLPAPGVPHCPDPVITPRPRLRDEIPLDVSSSSTVLPSHFNHLPLTVDRDPPVYGRMWPFSETRTLSMGQNLSQEALAFLAKSVYAQSRKTLDREFSRQANIEMIRAGGPLAIGNVNTNQLFKYPNGTFTGLDPPVEAGNALGLQDMNTEQRRIAKGKGRETEVLGESAAWNDVFTGSTSKEDEKEDTESLDSLDDSLEIKMENLETLEGQRVLATKKDKGKEKEVVDVKEVLPNLEGSVTKPVTPPKKELVAETNSIRSTRSTRSLAKALSDNTGKELRKVSGGSTGPTPGSRKVSGGSTGLTPGSRIVSGGSTGPTPDLQAVRHSQRLLGRTPHAVGSAAQHLIFDTPDQAIQTPLENVTTTGRPEHETPTQKRTPKIILRMKRPSEEELHKETKRVKEEEIGLTKKASTKQLAGKKGKGKENEPAKSKAAKGKEDEGKVAEK